MKKSTRSKLNIVSGGRHFSIFSYSLITTVRILYPYTSLTAFCTTEIGSKKVFQNKETPSTKTATAKSQCWDISKSPSWTESLSGKFQATMDPSFPLLFFFILFSHLCLPHAFSPPCISSSLLHWNAKFNKQFPVGTLQCRMEALELRGLQRAVMDCSKAISNATASADRWHKTILLLRETRWLTSCWAWMEKDI